MNWENNVSQTNIERQVWSTYKNKYYGAMQFSGGCNLVGAIVVGFNLCWVQFSGFNCVWVQFSDGFNLVGSVVCVYNRVGCNFGGGVNLVVGSILWLV